MVRVHAGMTRTVFGHYTPSPRGVVKPILTARDRHNPSVTRSERPRAPTGLAFVVPMLVLGVLVAAQWQTQSLSLIHI